MTLLSQLDARLKELHQQTAQTPLFNPVFQLSLELSRRIEKGELPLNAIAGNFLLSMKDYPPSATPGAFNLYKIQKQIEASMGGK